MDDKDVLQQNAEDFDLVSTDAYKSVKDRFDKELIRLLDLDSLSTNDRYELAEELINRKGAISVIRSIFDDIETRAEQYKDAQEALRPNPEQVVHRHSEGT